VNGYFVGLQRSDDARSRWFHTANTTEVDTTMQSHWHNLIVQQWHAHKWKLAALAAILLVVHTWILIDAACSGYDAIGDVGLLALTLFLCAAPGALFVGMGLAAGERSAGTFDFTRALPVASWKVAAAKLLMASITVVAPVAAIVLLDEVWLALARLAGRLVDTGFGHVTGFGYVGALRPLASTGLAGLAAAGLAVSILLWSAVAGARQPNELRAGIAAVGVLAIWALATYLLAVFGSAIGWGKGIKAVFLAVYCIGPAGLTALAVPHLRFHYVLAVIALQLVALVGLCVWFSYRYAHAGTDIARPPAKMATRHRARSTGLGPPRRGQLTALGWKQWRESLPICIGGLLLVSAVAVVGGIDAPTQVRSPWTAILIGVMEDIPAAAVFFGVVVALLVGIGTFVTELQPDLLTFWRSRPISPTLWFWTKYVTGAMAILLFLDGPVVVVACLAASGWIGVFSHPSLPLYLGYLGCAPLLHLLAFSGAVCLACVVREAVYAGILTVGLLLVAILAPELVPSLHWLGIRHVMDQLSAMPAGMGLVELAHAYLPILAAMLGLSAASTLLAWQAVVRDVSIKA